MERWHSCGNGSIALLARVAHPLPLSLVTDAEAAADWYEEEREGLGGEFMSALTEHVRRASETQSRAYLLPSRPRRNSGNRYAQCL